MKLLTILSLFVPLSFQLVPANNNLILPEIEIRSFLSIDDSTKIKLKESHPVHFVGNKKGTFVTYSSSNGETLGSLLLKEDAVESFYLGNFKPFESGVEDFYCASPIDFFKSEVELNEFLLSSPDESISFEDYSLDSLAVSHNDSSKYFPVDQNRFLKKEAGSTYYEGMLKEVPNYMNTMFNNNGCSPTSAAMYFSFIDAASSTASNLFVPNMPLKHTDDMSRVNSLIKDIGNNYFGTTNNGGTPRNKIAPGMVSYLSSHNIRGYKGYTTNDYSDFFYSINYAANPCVLSINNDTGNTGHSMLGIGTKDIWGSPTVKEWVFAQAVYNDRMETIGIPSTKVVQYYLIHK